MNNNNFNVQSSYQLTYSMFDFLFKHHATHQQDHEAKVKEYEDKTEKLNKTVETLEEQLQEVCCK